MLRVGFPLTVTLNRFVYSTEKGQTLAYVIFQLT